MNTTLLSPCVINNLISLVCAEWYFLYLILLMKLNSICALSAGVTVNLASDAVQVTVFVMWSQNVMQNLKSPCHHQCMP